jgi:lysophospholipase L1-like esterase
MRICFIGDSFVTGTGDDECLGWVGRLCTTARKAGHDITCYNLGIRRDTSADILARWRQEVERRKLAGVDLRLVFSFGTNDCTVDQASGAARLPHSLSLSSAEQILSTARRGFPVLMVGPLPVLDDPATDRRIELLSRDLAALCAKHEIPFLEVFGAMAECAAWRREAVAGDGSHPNAEGYAALARMIGASSPWQTWLRSAD